MSLGALSLIPPIFVVAFALITKKSASSLWIGVLITYVLLYGIHFLNPFLDGVYTTLMSEDYIWLAMLMVLLQMIIALLEVAGAKAAFARVVAKFATTDRRTMVANWLLAFPAFIDDVMGSAVKSTTIPIYNERKMPRAAMAYINDATAAPLAIFIPFTAWAAYFMGVFGEFEELAPYGTGKELYMNSVPYFYYGMAAMLVSLLFALQIIPPIGPMKKVWDRAKNEGRCWGEESDKYNNAGAGDELNAEIETRRPVPEWLRLILFFVPIVMIIVLAITTGDMVPALWITLLVTVPLYFIVGVCTWDKLMQTCIQGLLNVAGVLLIVAGAYSLRDATVLAGLPDFVIDTVAPIMSPAILPCLTFLICAILTFTTGSNWGIIVVTASVVIPLCVSIGANPFITIGALVSGAGFGAHICFYTDVTVLVSNIAKIENTEHCVTQLPYGIIGGVLALVAFAVAGYAVPI